MSRRALLLVSSAALVVGAAALCGDAGAGAPAGDARESARIELGRRLFFDPAIGRQGRIGCASCHDPEHGFSDPHHISTDESGLLPRRSQPLTDLAGEGFHWDGEFDTVRQVVEARVLPRGEVAVAALARSVTRAEHAPEATGPVDRDRLRERLDAGLAPQYYGDRLSQAVAAATPRGEVLGDGRAAPAGPV